MFFNWTSTSILDESNYVSLDEHKKLNKENDVWKSLKKATKS